MNSEEITSRYSLKLYITGQTAKSDYAIANLYQMFNDLSIAFDLTIIDVLEKPYLAEEDKVLATPTLIRISPLPVRRIIGDLSETPSVMLGLGLSLLHNMRNSGD